VGSRRADAILSAGNFNMFFSRPYTRTLGEPPRGAARCNLRVTSLKNLGTLHIPGFVATLRPSNANTARPGDPYGIPRGRYLPGNALSISPARFILAGALVSNARA
jgi:hypothetical protein